jgi:phosphatidylserine decarboxylase
MRVARESLPFVVILGLITLATGLLAPPALALVPLVALLFTLWFFRDPERVPPDDPRALVSPADGKVIVASDEGISVFMNIFDVHVCRTPAAGRVESIDHRSGSFLAAWKDEASEQNERALLVVTERERELAVTLVAGLVARRIVLRVTAGQRLQRGQRIGLIRFGSRVDVRFPAGTRAEVRVGDRVRAGESVLGRTSDDAAG